MDTLLSHSTALEVIRSAALSGRLEREERASVPVPELPPTRGEALELLGLVPGLSAPLHVTVTSGSRVGPSGLVATHVTRLSLPPGSAVPVAPGVFCVSPEHLVVQMAPSLTLVELVHLLGELLGTYALAPGRAPLPRRMSARVSSPRLSQGAVSGNGTCSESWRSQALRCAIIFFEPKRQAFIAPSFSDFFGSGTTSSGRKRGSVPSPPQTGQAPSGWRSEKLRGASGS